MEDLKILAQRSYQKARTKFILECTNCYVHDKFIKLSEEGKDIPKICKNCVDRLEFVETVNEIMLFRRKSGKSI